ncbi:MAG: DNA primase [Candidatus Marinimicrobia bacterium]|nr:DNA primase [Candidatus Neomarinimicrobiota bacterium]
MSSNVEKIKQRLTVVDVVGSYIKLDKAGANFKACCPFHSEKAPSFYVSPSREIWHCFGCNLGGDIFEFVKQIEGVDFPEALKILADRAGITLVFETSEGKSEKTTLFDLMNDATFFYQKQLTNESEVLNYLHKRGLKNETLKNFNIGFSPREDGGWRFLFNYLKGKGYSADQMEKVGLVIKKSADSYYDRFRGRIMFPLKDTSGRIVGFSGRVFGEEKDGVGKYINTPQTELYDKSKILYGFDRAKMEIRKKDACVLVEGQMDVVMAHQAGGALGAGEDGVSNTVAVSGTALTANHLDIIKRLTNNLIMAFDGDEAGLNAAKRSIDIALQEGFEIRAAFIESGKDPADVILEDPEKWEKAVNNSSHIVEFYMNVLEKKHGLGSRDFKLSVEKMVLPYLTRIESGVDRSHWVSYIANKLNVKEEIILEEMKKIKINVNTTNSNPINQKPKQVKSKQILLKEKIAGILLWKKDLSLEDCDAVKVFLKNLKDSEKDKFALEAELYYGDFKNIEEEVKNLAIDLKKEILKEQLEKIANEMRALEDKGDAVALEDKLNEFKKNQEELSGL